MINHRFLEGYFRMVVFFEPSWPKKTEEIPNSPSREPGNRNAQKERNPQQSNKKTETGR